VEGNLERDAVKKKGGRGLGGLTIAKLRRPWTAALGSKHRVEKSTEFGHFAYALAMSLLNSRNCATSCCCALLGVDVAQDRVSVVLRLPLFLLPPVAPFGLAR
jgi:hypothetical protein